MATFIVLKRPGPPTREVLVNLDEILMVQPGQGTGSAILFGREHLVSFEEDFATVIRRIQTGPHIQTNQTPATQK
jgi:hypothetical protein